MLDTDCALMSLLFGVWCRLFLGKLLKCEKKTFPRIGLWQIHKLRRNQLVVPTAITMCANIKYQGSAAYVADYHTVCNFPIFCRGLRKMYHDQIPENCSFPFLYITQSLEVLLVQSWLYDCLMRFIIVSC